MKAIVQRSHLILLCLVLVLCVLTIYARYGSSALWQRKNGASEPTVKALSKDLSTMPPAPVQSGGTYHLLQSVVAGGGGGPSAGGSNTVTGTVGQSSVGASSGGNYTVSGGFWAGTACPTITISPTNATLPVGQVGQSYAQAFTVSGGTPAYSFSTIAGALPGGVLLSTGGLLSGLPMVSGNFNFTVEATDANGCKGMRAYALTINPPCPGITVAPATLPNGFAGVSYPSQTFTASGGTAPYSFAVSLGTLPTGLSLVGDTLSGTPNSAGAFNFSVTATDNLGCQGSQAYTVTINTVGSGLQFYPLVHPVRLLDTRAGQPGCDAPGAMISGGTSRTQTAAGRTCDGLTIPANAKALTGNVTTVESGGGFLTLYPSDVGRPLVANSNFAANLVMNNVFTVGLGAVDGAFNIYVTTNTNVVVDITGYYAPPSASGLYFHPLPRPVRLLDTRTGATACFTPGAQLTAGSTWTQLGATTCDGMLIPAGAQALVGNATTVSPEANGFLTLFPANAARPLVASSNFQTGINMNAPFTVGLSPSGEFNIYTAATANLVVDVLGYFSTQSNDSNGQGLLFNSLSAPVRLLDTRAGATGCFTPGAQMIGGTAYLQPATGVCTGIPVAAKAVVGNATTVNVSANGFLTFWPSDANQPFVATSNYRSGTVFNRHFTVGLGSDGAFKRFASSTTDLVIDLSGYFAP